MRRRRHHGPVREPRPPLTAATRLERENRRELEERIVQLAEELHPDAGKAAVSTVEDVNGWRVVVLLGDHRLSLTGFRSEMQALVNAKMRLLRQLQRQRGAR